MKPENFYGEECWDNIVHEEIKYVFSDCNILIEEISNEIKDEVSEPFKKAFNKNKGLYLKAEEIMEDLMEDNKNKCLDYFDNMKGIECNRNFTINERYIDYVNKIQDKIDELLSQKELNKGGIEEQNEDKIGDNSEEKENKGEEREKEISDKFFFYTNINRKKFEDFINQLKEKKEKLKYERRNTQIMCSIFSYLKIFLDRFLDYLYNGILFYLLKSFQQNNLTQVLDNIL